MKNLIKVFVIVISLSLIFVFNSFSQKQLLIEGESFTNKGGWVVDQQFYHLMGSSYLLAHGCGKPVANAETKLALPGNGRYKIWVRTKDWVPDHEAVPGRFKISINGTEIEKVFGINKNWNWVSGGSIDLTGDSINITLIDQTGFDGRCDAIYLTTEDNYIPPNTIDEMTPWRKNLQGLPESPPSGGSFDLVVVGGGIAGCAASIAAAREGLSVALIQDRPVLGGNASQEIRVHTLGVTGSLIVDEINTEHWRNGHDDAIRDNEKRHAVIKNEPNITLFLSNSAFAVNKSNDNTISSVDIKHISTNKEQRIYGTLFVDATGDGWIGYWAGATYMIGAEDKSEFNEGLAAEILNGKNFNLRNMMGCTILWNAKESVENLSFPEVPWAKEVSKDYKSNSNYGHWNWEYGFGLNSIDDAEHIRDHLLRAIYGNFSNLFEENNKLYLDWVGYVIGKRESRRLVGDYILNQNDIENSFPFPDGVVTEIREIDIHYDNPSDNYDFISEAYFHKVPEYTIPYRSLYSKDISNLFMAGRCFSATHIGLGSPRVMNTTGKMGVAVGYAASLCKKYNTLPRGVYEKYIEELKGILKYDTSKKYRLKDIKVWPNPAKEYISLSELKYDEIIRIYNPFGTLILTTKNSNEIDISNLKIGLYFISSEYGGYGKFIKK